MGKIVINCFDCWKECTVNANLSSKDKYNYRCYVCSNIRDIKIAKKEYIAGGGFDYDYVSAKLDECVREWQKMY